MPTKRKTKPMDYGHAIEILDRTNALTELADLFGNEHGGCDDNTCSMTMAFDAGYSVMALEHFMSSGAASGAFSALYKTLPKAALRVALNQEIDQFRTNPECRSIECGCGAHIYRFDSQGSIISCSNCGREFARHAADGLGA